jgi:ribosomal protein L37E
MTITAKYAGRCRRCGGRISVGDQIEWSKGEGARHVECESRPAATTHRVLNGQLWEECPRCGREPVYISLGGLCEHCG